MSALVEPFFEVRRTRGRATHQVMGQDRGTLRRFVEVCGDRPVDAYGRGDITRFLGMLRRLPTTYGKSPRDKDRSLAQIIAEADGKGAKRLIDKTVKRQLSVLSQFFQFAMDAGHLTIAARGELVESHRFRDERSARGQRDTRTRRSSRNSSPRLSGPGVMPTSARSQGRRLWPRPSMWWSFGV